MGNPLFEYKIECNRMPNETKQTEALLTTVGIVTPQDVTLFSAEAPLQLDCGETLGPIEVRYETYGTLNEAKDNAILIIHALSGNAHAAGKHAESDANFGWWENMIGPGKTFDTDTFHVICSNSLGGCSGTTGPTNTNPDTGNPYGLSFPMITIGDMVEVQRSLIDHLGIDKLVAIAGGSMGGMQILEWSIRYTERFDGAIILAATSKLSPQGIAFNAVGRNAIIRDEHFANGEYYNAEHQPSNGLAIARMIGHITYLSEAAMHVKFGRRLQNVEHYTYSFESEFSVETYLDYQGTSFTEVFDANSYLFITKAMDYFDLGRDHTTLTKAFEKTFNRFLVISFDSDWLFPAAHSQEITNALIAAQKEITYCNIHCDSGHDSFLIETKVQGGIISGFIESTYKKADHTAGDDQAIKLSISNTTPPPKNHRADISSILALITPGASVLDLGCGGGELLQRLINEKQVPSMGVTLGEQDIVACSKRGVNVVQYDVDEPLSRFGNDSFEFVILSQTLQEVQNPLLVLREMLRIGNKAIVSFPNFAYWRHRCQIFFGGKTPIGKALPNTWYDKTSVNYMSISDFEQFISQQLDAKVLQTIPLVNRHGKQVNLFSENFAETENSTLQTLQSFFRKSATQLQHWQVQSMPNLFADEAIFVLTR